MTHIIIAISMLTAQLYPVISFGFYNQKDCQEFIDVMIVAPEPNMMYGCFEIDDFEQLTKYLN